MPEIRTTAQDEDLAALLNVADALELLLKPSDALVTPDTVEFFSSTFGELTSLIIPAFKFIRHPKRIVFSEINESTTFQTNVQEQFNGMVDEFIPN